MESLPIHAVLPDLREALANASSVVLSAPPGSGKTTIVPLELLDESWLAGKKILMLEPRRLATRASALRMAQLLGEKIGAQVGYRVRFDSCVSRQTRVEVVTEGILTRRLQHDPELDGVSLVIFDEFHERSLHADLALALCNDVQGVLRDDLRLLVMSATLDTGRISSLLNDAPVVKGEGRSYPVDIHYLEKRAEGLTAKVTVNAVLRALNTENGDILVFLPCTGEIRQAEQLLNEQLGSEVVVCSLYGNLSKEAQDRAILPDEGGRRRVVLATSIAETSLTIEGIACVVDSGWSRLPQFDPNSGLTRLQTLRVSLASADQRAGRAGRLGPGVCYRLWTASEHSLLNAHTPPEIQGADLAQLALELASWGVADPADLRWLDSPPKGAYAQAKSLLLDLEAIDEKGRITETGGRMVESAVHPRLGHMLNYACSSGQISLAADLAAILTERDLLRRERGGDVLPVDIDDRLQLLNTWREQGKRRMPGIDHNACRRVEQASRQWRRAKVSEATLLELSTGGLLGLAFPDRIAKRRSPDGEGYLLAGGRGARLPEGDRLCGSEFLVMAQLDAGRSEGRVFLAAEIRLDEISSSHTRRISRETQIGWDKASAAVTAREEERLGAVVLSFRPLEEIDPEAQLQGMLEGVRQMGLKALPWSRESEEWLRRLRFLGQWQPDAGWPDVSEQGLMKTLDTWLGPWLAGMSRRDHLKRLDMKAVVTGLLDWESQQRMDDLVPTHIKVPSGSRKRIDYVEEGDPVLAVKLQEMFGLADTPTICGGKVALQLHLLSPAQRPIQVTRDLCGFWERTYQEVKKELKGRYPKHYWPDDPWSAVPTARVRPKT
ncbi:ATP-dependent helicase HrpB [Solemya velesiana gill symbiont]|uniref:ATP-dependent helicase HrpB n=1 Tax=Solemya velesiana gill symbiont TaxID=1918948 RepID=A0A1T2KWC4_9GAMM|nr:ATP-dependent helicase HrpB [Solemya velesiana gill symbiont]OOZ37101.1 ATP-dependent helicase HrpB [Solemya velesiana gill symbiont]